ncbi:MAG: DNA-directed RNA polymerase subunit N [Euryarchaeota archaeon]|nr:DNA-directed RNA polymerase subunit N [Euryarchaeota archaeon]
MLLPVRCFSCGKVLGHLWDQYDERQKSGEDAGEILTDLKIERYCCRRMFVSHVELIDDVAPFSTTREI